ncbi:MAG: hypothetical protein R3F56_25240 [Planctomycetota bacterium]
MHRLLSSFASFAAPVVLSVAAPAQAPAVELGSVLDGIQLRPESGELDLVSASFLLAFLPPPEIWDPRDVAKSGGHALTARVRRGDTVVGKIGLYVEPVEGKFSSARTIGGSNALAAAGFSDRIKLMQAGAYEFEVTVDDEVALRLPMQVRIDSVGDEFSSQKRVVADGPWAELGYLALRVQHENSPVSQHLWLRRRPDSNESQRYDLRVWKDGDIVAEGAPVYASALEWQHIEIPLSAPRGKAKGVFGVKELFASDGRYVFELASGDKTDSVFVYEVSGGKPAPHPRSASSYSPRSEYLLPRKWARDSRARAETFWCDRVSGDAAAQMVAASRPRAAGPASAEARAGWTVPPSAINAATPLTLTMVAVRHDTALAVGDGIVVGGTGANTGVTWMRVGDKEAQPLPKGQEYSSQVFAACGKKIVLVDRQKHVVVFDTASGQSKEIPGGQITLVRPVGGLYRASPLAADGYLAATINNEGDVTDKRAIKVLDVSGAEPSVIALRLPDGVLARNLTAIAVDAVAGKVAVACPREHALFVGDIADGNVLARCDLSGHDGIADAPIRMQDGLVLYRDGSGSGSKARLWNVANGSVVSPAWQGMPSPPCSFALGGGVVAAPVTPGRGNAFPVACAKTAGGEAALPGEDGPGRGKSVAVTADGVVVVASVGSLGSDAALHVRGLDGKWRALTGPDGKELSAGDVVHGHGLVAFKVGKGTSVMLGFVGAPALQAAN